MRIEEASRMLFNTNLSVGEVADQCGYGDIYGFSRAFARVTGVSPSAFRRKMKEG
jgi:AraC-like DNA-binding protein